MALLSDDSADPNRVDPDDVHKIVCLELNLDSELVKSKSRKREVVKARQIIFYLAYKYSGLSLKKIGEPYLKRDHSTIIHNIEQFHNWYDTEPNFKALVEKIEGKIV